MQQDLPEAEVVNKYTLTSGNDVPERDPKSWTLEGSNDGENWEELDRREREMWSRTETREFTVENETACKYYRLSMYENNGGGFFQISEWRLQRLQLINPTDSEE